MGSGACKHPPKEGGGVGGGRWKEGGREVEGGGAYVATPSCLRNQVGVTRHNIIYHFTLADVL